MHLLAKVTSVQIGEVLTYPVPAPGEGEWRSAIAKHPVEGPVWLDRLGLAGDAQADEKHHGGAGQAINVYPSEHYSFWRLTPGLESITGGGFGENLTTQGLLETNACIGDVFQIGQAEVWITQPRVPCYKLDRRWAMDDLRERATSLGLVGWYFAVRQPGYVQHSDEIVLLERPNPDWTIAKVWENYLDSNNLATMRSLTEAQGLSEKWRDMLLKKIQALA